MRAWVTAIVVTIALACPMTGLAHEGHTHKAIGTITSVQGDKVGLKTTDGKNLTLVLDKKTTVTRGRDKLETTALTVGERVSVEYMEAKKVLTAHALKLGTAQTAKK